MSTATKTWDKKSVYHSELVRASQGGLGVMFTGPVRDSKYAGKPPYVNFKVYGDESDYSLNIENAEIRKTLEGVPTNVWVSVRADGTRDMAWIVIEDANGNPVLGGVPVGEIAQPAGPPPLWNNEGGKGAPQPKTTNSPTPTPTTSEDDELRTKLADRYYLALTAAQDACNRFAQEHGGLQPSDAVRNIATTLFINASNSR